MSEEKEKDLKVLEEISHPGTVVSYKATDGSTNYRYIAIPGVGYDIKLISDKDGEAHVCLEEPTEEITKDNVGDTYIYYCCPGFVPLWFMKALLDGSFERNKGEIVFSED